MKITIITLFPKMIEGFFKESIIARAVEKKLLEINIVNLRDFAVDGYGSVDDRPYGGGAGMILRIEPIYKAINKITNDALRIKNKNPQSVIRNKIILTSAKGQVFNQAKAVEYSKLDSLVIVAGHYEGVDERVLDYIDEEISMGDFVTTGGEIPAAAILDAVTRLIPGVLKKQKATIEESFSIDNKKLLEYPQYTRPEVFKGKKVPKILLSGDHQKIEKWRLEKAYEETRKKRPDLLRLTYSA